MSNKRLKILQLVAACAVAAAVQAQVPPDAAEKIRAIGRKVDTLATARIYAPMQTKLPDARVRVERELKYGTHAKQVLDVFMPTAKAAGPRPVLMMVHGGGFVAGDKSIDETGAPSAFYDNIMLWATKNGMVGVNVNYRIAPEFKYPAVQEDLGAAVRWVQQNISRYGGDPARISMMGHSAGAAHVASYVAHPEFGPGGDTGLLRAIFSSGSYDFPGGGATPHAYFGEESAQRSSIPGLLATKIPYFVIVAQYDPPNFHVQAGKLMNAIRATGNCPPFLLLKDHGHMSGVYAINSPDVSLSGPVLAFLQEGNAMPVAAR